MEKVADQKLTITLDLGDRTSWDCALVLACEAGQKFRPPSPEFHPLSDIGRTIFVLDCVLQVQGTSPTEAQDCRLRCAPPLLALLGRDTLMHLLSTTFRTS